MSHLQAGWVTVSVTVLAAVAAVRFVLAFVRR